MDDPPETSLRVNVGPPSVGAYTSEDAPETSAEMVSITVASMCDAPESSTVRFVTVRLRVEATLAPDTTASIACVSPCRPRCDAPDRSTRVWSASMGPWMDEAPDTDTVRDAACRESLQDSTEAPATVIAVRRGADTVARRLTVPTTVVPGSRPMCSVPPDTWTSTCSSRFLLTSSVTLVGPADRFTTKAEPTSRRVNEGTCTGVVTLAGVPMISPPQPVRTGDRTTANDTARKPLRTTVPLGRRRSGPEVRTDERTGQTRVALAAAARHDGPGHGDRPMAAATVRPASAERQSFVPSGQTTSMCADVSVPSPSTRCPVSDCEWYTTPSVTSRQ